MSSSAFAADAPTAVPVEKALESITVPEGFNVSMFAGEPGVVQPIAMTTDARGRLWVVECLSYPNWTTNKTGEDRVIILEDADQDGRFDKRTVFLDNGRNLSGIALGFGGVWLCSLPELIFVPDRNGDDKPDREWDVLLDGWDMGIQHNVFNGLTWGPDGWLYGGHGILKTSYVGKPGTPQEERVPINCGVWRFHPTRKVFEVVAHGTTNPWGIAFDEYGQMFIANCVIKHLFHMIPGGRYERMFGQDFNPYAFELIPSVADHIHWAGGYWKTEGAESPNNDVAGGGHAHSGATIYLGETWPEKFRGTFLTVNIHGHRVNNDALVRQGSGYVAKHLPDLMRVSDTWFRGVSVVPAHDGAVYVSDWSDAGECHDYEDIHRDNGRIYKVQYGEVKKPYVDVRRMNDRELLDALGSKDEWMSSNARLVLRERAESRDLQPVTTTRLQQLFTSSEGTRERLRALWALHAIGRTPRLEDVVLDRDEYVRGWTVQLALEDPSNVARAMRYLVEMANNDASPFVRLYLASALQRLSADDRVRVAAGLVKRAEDSGDHNLPLLIWYGIEPVVSKDEAAALKILEAARIPKVRRFITQRLALRMALNGVVELMGRLNDPGADADIVYGLSAALNGRRDIKKPEKWETVAARLRMHPSTEVRNEVLKLGLVFGDGAALGELQARVLDTKRSAGERVQSLETLNQTRRPELVSLLQRAIADPVLRQSAIKGLAAYENAETPKLILELYGKLKPEARAEAINTLSSRESYAVALLEAVKDGRVPRKDITPFSARQIQAYGSQRLKPLLEALGSVREIAGDKVEQIARYKVLLTPAALGQADVRRGRAVYERTCASCHTLFDEGGKVAPELTGSQRTNLDYILENVVDPNAVVWDRYKATYFETSDDRLISGVLVNENESTVTIQTQTGTITLPRTEITSRRQSDLSMMPEGLFQLLDEQEIKDLVAYLQSPQQVPLPQNN
ncbi:MAG TPA: PVC-type heme-binding CxxCH protein [Verrucomicrobiae bacterium]